METTNLNATLDCIKETTTFATRVITNVCTGQVTIIPIGFWQFVAFIGLGLLIVALAYIMFAMVNDMKNY